MKRAFALWLLCCCLVPSASAEEPRTSSEEPSSQSAPPPPAKKETLFFYLQGNPEGLAVIYDLELPGFGPFLVGLNHAYYATALAGEISLRYRYLGGLLDVLAGVGAESGFYYQTQPGSPPPTTRAELGPLTLGVKRHARAEGKLNLKLSHVWLYGRASPTFRFRDYVELEPRRGINLGVKNEFSFGYAAALLFRIWGSTESAPPSQGYRPEGWLYAEYTGESVTRYASDTLEGGRQTAISRPSFGLIAQAPFGWSGVTLNLDIYYSLIQGPLLDDPLSGVGAQLLVWWEL